MRWKVFIILKGLRLCVGVLGFRPLECDRFTNVSPFMTVWSALPCECIACIVINFCRWKFQVWILTLAKKNSPPTSHQTKSRYWEFLNQACWPLVILRYVDRGDLIKQLCDLVWIVISFTEWGDGIPRGVEGGSYSPESMLPCQWSRPQRNDDSLRVGILVQQDNRRQRNKD